MCVLVRIEILVACHFDHYLKSTLIHYQEVQANSSGRWGNMRRLELTIKDKKYMKKIHLLLRILAVIGRYGSQLMIVMTDIFDPK